jgi:small-conductance mechanosensitive channel
VEDIQLRATRLRLISGEEVSVPNLLIFGNAVINNTHYGERRSILEVTLPVAEFSREETNSLILQALDGYEEVMAKPEPAVMIVLYAEGKVTLHVRFWVATGQIIDISSVMYELHELLPTANISVKEPV